MTAYKAKKSNLKELLSKSNTELDVLATNTNIPMEQLTAYLDTKVMSLNNAMSISKELNCTIEDLYVWKVSEE
ncbi:helix-turn-helix domain-containing protein [Metabacillus sediminilitoris]|uniref:helix-turn-helix domain-containing protein n=1 Tax=Metabacillus sediminilitoris TaxID=2567941 RepID=UPI0018B06268|nr:helix-turn-helix domain-containing protein [Metabacillus sediminilitoris]